MKIKEVETEEEFQMAFCIRKKVFVEEQGVTVSEEIDGYEAQAQHIVVYEEHLPIGAARLRVVAEGTVKFERICILSSYRQKGIGNKLVRFLEQTAQNENLSHITLSAQLQAEKFYEKLGYQRTGGVFSEAGIKHVTMVKDI